MTDRWHAQLPPLRAEDHARMAENCESAVQRLASSESIADQMDATALSAAAAIHRKEAERLTPATYWWQDKHDDF